MPNVREFFESPAGKAVAGAIVLIALVALFLSVRSNFASSEIAAATGTWTYMCAETGQPFRRDLEVGQSVPVPSPHSGKNTGYPAEFCGWTKDGTIRSEPLPVLLNEYANRPGPTFCADCDRLVVARNPLPQEGDKAPPTSAEFRTRPVVGGRQ